MRTSLISICGFLLLSSTAVLAGSWTLPRGVSVRDDGPRTYRLTKGSGDYMDSTTS
jgi:hypothetical protein